jgi:transposase
MATPISADYQTPFLLPPSLEDWVPPHHPVRFIAAFVDQLPWAKLGFKAQPCLDGRPPYSNQMLLKVWLFAYLNKIRSSRVLERACHEQLSLIWLTGMNYPDHNTLWRFWRDNRAALGRLFKQSIKVALKMDLVGLTLQALDGTKIQAASSGRTGWTQEQALALEKTLDQQLQSTEQKIQEDKPEEGAEYALKGELTQPEQLREKVKTALAELEESGRKHYHGQEPEARRMPCDGRNRFGYNAQAVVDDQSGIITAAEVTNSENDIGQLVPMLQQAQENVGAAVKENVADSGYGSGTDLLAAAQTDLQVTTYLPNDKEKDGPYHSSRFEYQAQPGTLKCPEGRLLDPKKSRSRHGQEIKIFRCPHTDCPVRAQCSKDPKGRKVEIWQSRGVIEAMRQKKGTPAGKAALKRRREVVEPTFARIKQHLGFRRWTMRGLEKVKAQWAMICLTINLQIMMKQKAA